MSTTYNTVIGDTFEKIARKKYGTADGALIKSANPAVSEPIPAGTALVIPRQQATPTDQTAGTAAANVDEVAVSIGGEVFHYWENISITRTLDSIDTFTLSAPSNPKLKPLAFASAQVTVGGVPLFTGTQIGVTPTVNGSREVDEASGYALPGVLNDCTMPASGEPLEFREQTLEGVAASLLKPFGLSSEFDGAAGEAFDIVAMGEGDRVLRFLTKLATDRGLVMGSTPAGALRFSAPKEGEPVAKLQQGQSPLATVVPMFSPQEYYSDVTGVEPSLLGLEGRRYTVKNTRLTNVVRPFVYLVLDAPAGGIKAAVEAKAARMFAGAVSYLVDVPTWRTEAGELWSPGDTVQLHAPAAKVTRPYNFLIRSVIFTAGPNGRTATLTLVLPTVFSSQIPEAMPWDE